MTTSQHLRCFTFLLCSRRASLSDDISFHLNLLKRSYSVERTSHMFPEWLLIAYKMIFLQLQIKHIFII